MPIMLAMMPRPSTTRTMTAPKLRTSKMAPSTVSMPRHLSRIPVGHGHQSTPVFSKTGSARSHHLHSLSRRISGAANRRLIHGPPDRTFPGVAHRRGAVDVHLRIAAKALRDHRKRVLDGQAKIGSNASDVPGVSFTSSAICARTGRDEGSLRAPRKAELDR